MEFPTIQFAYFAVATLTVAWLLERNRTVQKAFLLAASYLFAWKWHPLFLGVLVGSSVMNWAFGKVLVALRGRRGRQPVLTLSLLANLGILGFFKYHDFFTDNLAALLAFLGLEVHLPLIERIAPFGISFYTVQSMAYLVDTYRDTAVQPKTLLDFCLFVAFFPKFGAGPICRSHELLPQIMAPAPKGIPELSRAIALIVSGLVKKMIIGAYLASHLTTDAFLTPWRYSSLELLLAVFAYTAQVYLDFSGYTDLARGIGLLFGFDLPENFDQPYRATNIGEFWRRWHITFSRWLSDYIYFPLGGSRAGRLRCYVNLVVTFLACGLWHGASWGYVIWGGLHGLGLAVYKASLDIRRHLGVDTAARGPCWVVAGGWLLTLSFCAFTRVFFRASDVPTALEFFAGLLALTADGAGFDLGVLALTVLTIGMNFFGRDVFEGFVRWHERLPDLVRPVAWVGIMLALFALKPYDTPPTIYFGF